MLPGVDASHSHKRRSDITATVAAVQLAAKRREKIAQRVSAGLSCSSMPQPQRGGMSNLCRRFAASAAASRLVLSIEINPGLAPWATALTPLRGFGNKPLSPLRGEHRYG